MSRPEPDDTVLVLDLRSREHREHIDMLDADKAHEIGVPSRVLLIDRSAMLVDNQPRYQRIASLAQVTKVILVAVGSIRDKDDRPLLRQPAALNDVGVTLWVGDERGVRWTGGAQPGRSRGESDQAMLNELTATLRLPAVFDRVFDEVRGVPHQAVSPGLEIEYATVDPATLNTLRIRAMQQVTATGVFARPHDTTSTALAGVTGTVGRSAAARSEESGGLRVGSPLHERRIQATNAATRAKQALSKLRGVRGLLGPVRSGQSVFSSLGQAGVALREHGKATHRVLRDIDGNIAVGSPATPELVQRGLPVPVAADSPLLATTLETAVTAELNAGRTLSSLADQARQVGNDQSVVGDAAAPAELDTIEHQLTHAPELILWPTPLATAVLPTGLLTCLAGAALPGIGTVVGPLLVLLWALVVALLLIRRPVETGEAGWDGTAVVPLGVVMLGPLAGHAIGLLLLPKISELSLAAGIGVAVALGCVCLATGVLVWNRAVDTWSRALPVDRAQSVNHSLAKRLDTALAKQWIPAETNRKLADALIVIATGLEVVREVLADVITYHETNVPDRQDEPSPALATPVMSILRQDLVSITLAVLRSCFDDIRTQATLSSDVERFRERVRDLIEDYNDHLEHLGLRGLPAGVADNGPRRALFTDLFQGSEAVQRILLTNGRSEMIQLCRVAEIRLLKPGEAKLLHFAPADIQHLIRAESTDVTWTSGDAVCALRLVPLRAGIAERSVTVGQPGDHNRGRPSGQAGQGSGDSSEE